MLLIGLIKKSCFFLIIGVAVHVTAATLKHMWSAQALLYIVGSKISKCTFVCDGKSIQLHMG